MNRQTLTSLVNSKITIDYRKNRFEYFQKKKPGFIPIFVGFHDDDIIYRYLLHEETLFSHLLFAFRKRRKIKATEAVFALVETYDTNNKIIGVAITHGSTIQSLYERFKQKDGFLYINLKFENTFG